MALCYINRGLCLEQAIAFLIQDYFQSLNLAAKYPNFHVNVTTEHPFAELFMHEGLSAADTFPAVVVTTQDDKKPNEVPIAPRFLAIGIDESELAEITNTKESYLDKRGNLKTRDIAGLCTVIDEKTENAIKKTITKQGLCYGWSIRTRRKDSISIEIWCENNQMKNELYEQIRLFVSSYLPVILYEKYAFFAPNIFDNSVVGHRSSNYNFQFDTTLCGSQITFDIDYCVEQNLFNTDLSEISPEFQIEWEVKNHVKGQNGNSEYIRQD